MDVCIVINCQMTMIRFTTYLLILLSLEITLIIQAMPWFDNSPWQHHFQVEQQLSGPKCCPMLESHPMRNEQPKILLPILDIVVKKARSIQQMFLAPFTG
ncbi:hypothetical protein DERF_004042 [Dermatophagoides farinae]|mgnify:CR=1 FL=1|uniref:Uncharacterized protein n=1 Tax=Dermatophagoides farinae TaxID=6954 RepID=A0A922IGJ4_DERFA|nr:hypothetical protein DERF_004042 [Dermatophagoides farinae]